MNISKQCIEFWSTLEEKIGDFIPYHIKNLFAYNGFTSAQLIARLTKTEVEKIEESGKSILQDFAERSYGVLLERDRKLFVGRYTNDPKQFRFQHGEMVLIDKLITFTAQHNIKEFYNNEQAKHDNIVKSAVGYVFGPVKSTIQELELINAENEIDERHRNFTLMLQELNKTADYNSGRTKYGQRYTSVIKYFSIYVYLIGGKMTYEFIQANLMMPSTPSITKYVAKYSSPIIEGDLRSKDLSDYLEKLNLPKFVVLSEDATGVVSDVIYDNKTNQLIGLCLPLDVKTGMPVKFTFLARSSNEIKNHLTNDNNSVSTLLYVVMAQPLKESVPAMPVLIYGTNNKFDAADKDRQLDFIQKDFEKYGIQILGLSSDADSCLLKLMKFRTQVGCKDIRDAVLPFYFNSMLTDITFVQDPIHEAVKRRNRLLDSSTFLPMGSKIVSIAFLKILIKTVPKTIHGLVISDITPDDRQNFQSLQKIMQNRVFEALEKYVPDSAATILYFQLCKDMNDAYTDPFLTPLERVFKVWTNAFFFRKLRYWVKKNKYKLSEHFITDINYACIELNAHAMVNIIITLKQMNKPELFLPLLFQSQTCEATFRLLRSMTTMEWTKINSNMAEVLHMFKRVELQNDIMYFKLSKEGVHFPRTENKKQKMKIFEMPSIEGIIETMESAKEYAIKICKQFDIDSNDNDSLLCHLNKVKTIERAKPKSKNVEVAQNSEINNNCDTNRDNANEQENYLSLCNGLLDSNKVQPSTIKESSILTTVKDSAGKEKVVRKSTLVWALTSGKGKLSNDRLTRVQGCTIEKVNNSYKNDAVGISNLTTDKQNSGSVLKRGSSISEGQWCIFSCKEKQFANATQHHTIDSNNIIPGVIFGRLLAFKYIDGRTKKDRRYIKQTVSVEPETDFENRKIEALAVWYKCTETGKLLITDDNNSCFKSTENYLATVTEDPSKNDAGLFFKQEFMNKFSTDLLEIKEAFKA